MIEVNYSRGKLIAGAALALFCGPVAWLLSGMIVAWQAWLIQLLAIAAIVAGLRLAAKAMGSMIALREESEGLRVVSLWSNRVVPWHRLIGVAKETIAAGASTTNYLTIAFATDDRQVKKVRLTRALLAIDDRQVAGLEDALARRADGTRAVREREHRETPARGGFGRRAA